MVSGSNGLRREEQISISLKLLYLSYGYREFKLSSFEEYSLYAENQNFRGGKDVISFSSEGKLLALRPDVTLSIIKNGRFVGETVKLFYDEKVFRRAKCGGGFSELSQIGAEVIGRIDLATEAELCTLMMKTLAAVDEDFVLSISHAGITGKVLKNMDLCGDDLAFALQCLENKSLHDLERFFTEKGLAGENLIRLITLPAERTQALSILKDINRTVNISDELYELVALTEFVRSDKINFDFSIGGDAEYYNGLVFKGYVAGAPHAVLSGGRYDKLLRKFQRRENALGFALYLGELGKYIEDTPVSPDAAVVYTDDNAVAAFQTAEALRAEGKKVFFGTQVPEGFTGKIYCGEQK